MVRTEDEKNELINILDRYCFATIMIWRYSFVVCVIAAQQLKCLLNAVKTVIAMSKTLNV